MTVLHLTCLWWRDSNRSELQMKNRVQRGLTLSKLPQGFTILGTTDFVATGHFTAEISTFWGKINFSDTVQTAEGPFGFLIYVTDRRVVSTLVQYTPALILMRTVDRRQPYFVRLTSGTDYFMQCSDFCHVYKCYFDHCHFEPHTCGEWIGIWWKALFLTWIIVD